MGGMGRQKVGIEMLMGEEGKLETISGWCSV